ncbi:UDP-N-acetylenolpyruvoylglucosamine reductase [Aerococcus urinaehominis]|uniref:UDP-N-acetylenolpyruvoylglucosamine reductase n=1 Tax=Aerococcus urinaehominis TaxID=128944 RepID=A0A0X8FMI7_9LACT|nr:UDP-N-acetylmuramate dehydrogenase [Aerococcus urinaehominis]AMB99814.1 UDP-N-acetylenolpyruvoylglucosamine reductase [Aerococcus urinaehominis]SDM60390.1 UDP-N-acetylmuramate dehydrogenase [Aerococcus urinaehominis]
MNRADLQATFPNSEIKFDEPLNNYSYTKTGGPGDAVAFPTSIHEVAALVKYAQDHDIPVLVLGNASNIIVRDGGVAGLVLILTKMKTVVVNDQEIVADAGAEIIRVSQIARDHSLTGLEFACGIPGSIGGAIYMNAGAYGGEVQTVVKSATVVSPSGDIKEMSNQDLDFAYRHSSIQDTGDIVVQVTFALTPGDQAKITAKMAELTDLRESKQPLEYPSCGSVFKRPAGYFTGKLIQEAGLQGYTIGGVQVSKKHAGFMVNIDEGTATDYIDLIAHVQAVIKEKDGVDLEPEVRIIGREK